MSAVRFGVNGKQEVDRGVRSGVCGRMLLHNGQSTASCQPPHPLCRREKNHFKMQVAQNVWPQLCGINAYGQALMDH